MIVKLQIGSWFCMSAERDLSSCRTLFCFVFDHLKKKNTKKYKTKITNHNDITRTRRYNKINDTFIQTNPVANK